MRTQETIVGAVDRCCIPNEAHLTPILDLTQVFGDASICPALDLAISAEATRRQSTASRGTCVRGINMQ